MQLTEGDDVVITDASQPNKLKVGLVTREFTLLSQCVCLSVCLSVCRIIQQEGLAIASIVRDDPYTLPGDDPFPRARMHRDRNAL